MKHQLEDFLKWDLMRMGFDWFSWVFHGFLMGFCTSLGISASKMMTFHGDFHRDTNQGIVVISMIMGFHGDSTNIGRFPHAIGDISWDH